MRGLAVLGLALGAASSLWAQSRAIVVGVGGYPNLPKSRQLHGTVNDANAIGDALKGQGFTEVTRILDEKATKETILKALDDAAAAKWGPGDRFVFYFAGHGTNKPRPSIGPYDGDAAAKKWITAEELNDRVKAIPSASRTVILDACFSGSMIKDVAASAGARFYEPPSEPGTTKSADYEFDDAPTANNPSAVAQTPGKEVCYVAAAGPGQQAFEASVPPGATKPTPRGVFSYYLADQMAKPNLSWGAAVQAVRAGIIRDQVKLELLQVQTPLVSNPFDAKPMFAAISAPPAKPTKPTSLLKMLAAERQNPAALSMVAASDKAMMVGEPRLINVTLSDPGYLIVVEQIGNKFRRINRPEAETADDLKEDPAIPVRLRVIDDKPGTAVLKGILIDDKAAAQALLELLPYGKEFGGDDAAVTKEAFAEVSGYTTAYANLRIADDLLGHLRIKDPAKAWAALRGTDDRAKVLQSTISRPYPGTWAKHKDGPDANVVGLKTLLNILLSDRLLAKNLALANVPLGPLAPEGTKTDAAGAVERNAKLLVALLDGALEPTPAEKVP